MKRFLISILALLCIAGESFAQIPELKPLKDLEDVLNPAEKKGKWGFANGSGKMIIKAVFEAADPFDTIVSADGTIMQVARVKANGSWGYITRENVYLIEPVYDTITKFDRFATVVATSGPFKSLIGVRTTTSPRLNVPVLASTLLQLNLNEIVPAGHTETAAHTAARLGADAEGAPVFFRNHNGLYCVLLSYPEKVLDRAVRRSCAAGRLRDTEVIHFLQTGLGFLGNIDHPVPRNGLLDIEPLGELTAYKRLESASRCGLFKLLCIFSEQVRFHKAKITNFLVYL